MKWPVRVNVSVPWWAVLIVLLGGAYVFYLAFYASPPGYCSSKKRYLSDLDYIEISIHHERGIMDMQGAQSSLDYYFSHPDCCSVDRNKPVPSERILFGDGENVTVHLFYKRKDGAISKQEPPYRDVVSVITPCGLVADAYGLNVEEMPAYFRRQQLNVINRRQVNDLRLVSVGQ